MHVEISDVQFVRMLETIGLKEYLLEKERHDRPVEAMKNDYCIHHSNPDFPLFEDLVDKNLMIARQDGTLGWVFHLSQKGFKWLTHTFGIKITEIDDSF